MNIIGIDGGGTKTEGVLFNVKTGQLDHLVDKASNPHSTSFENSVNIVIRMITTLLNSPKAHNNQDVYVCIGIAGLGRKDDRQKWQGLFEDDLPNSNKIKDISIETDALIALYSGTYGEDGIVSICGTGAITYGINNHVSLRIGGWGHLISADPGSGYYIGYQGLQSVFEQFDQLAPCTSITSLMMDGEKVTEPSQLINLIYSTKNEKNKIASLAKYIFQAAESGDEIADKIIHNTALEIVKFGTNLYERLYPYPTKSNRIPYILVGGLFKNKILVSKVISGLKSNSDLEVTVSENTSAMGSVVNVLKKQGYSSQEIKDIIQKANVKL